MKTPFFIIFVILYLVVIILLPKDFNTMAQYGDVSAPVDEGGSNDPTDPGNNSDESQSGGISFFPPSAPQVSCDSTQVSWTPSSNAIYYDVWRRNSSIRTEGNGLYGQYFNDKDLNGFVSTRVDEEINKSWGDQSPIPNFDPNTFSVRWTGQIKPEFSEDYTFYVRINDGARLWIDDKSIIGRWNDRTTVEEFDGRVRLEANKFYSIRLEYYDNKGDAQVELSWSSPSTPKQIISKKFLYTGITNAELIGQKISDSKNIVTHTKGLYAQYFDTRNLQGVSTKRIDNTINFPNWGTGSPDPTINTDKFSARWSGQIKAETSEEYTFYVKANDGVRLWIDDQEKPLIDKWNNRTTAEEFSKSISLKSGQFYSFKLEYYDDTGDAQIQLSWSTPTIAKEIVPKDQFYYFSNPTLLNSTLEPGLYGQYFNEKDFKTIAFSRPDRIIKFPDWGAGSPDPMIDPDNFSIRWVGQIKAETSEEYTFYVKANDGVKLFITTDKEEAIINETGTRTIAKESSGKINLKKDQYYNIKLEYFDQQGDAQVELSWSTPTIAKEIVPDKNLFHNPTYLNTSLKPGLYGQYYNEKDLNGTLYLTTSDSVINFKDWGIGPPDPSMNSDKFSVRWTGQIKPEFSEEYTFYVRVNDGARLWVDDRKIIDKWNDRETTQEFSNRIQLEAGQFYNIKLEYYDDTGDAQVELYWSSASTPRQVVPSEKLFHNDIDNTSGQIRFNDPNPILNPQFQVMAVGSGGVTPSAQCPYYNVSDPPTVFFDFISLKKCYSQDSWKSLTPQGPQPIKAIASHPTGIASVTFRLTNVSDPSKTIEVPAVNLTPGANPSTWQYQFNGVNDLDTIGGFGIKYTLDVKAQSGNNRESVYLSPMTFSYQNLCAGPYIQTTGGDVHTNESIYISE